MADAPGASSPTSCREAVASVLGDRVSFDVGFGERTTYRVGGNALALVEAADVETLIDVGRASAASGLPVMTLGRGSNILVADSGFDGIVVVLGDEFATIDIQQVAGGGGAELVVGGCVLMPVLARRTVAEGLTGLEWMVGVPGSVGGAVRMNAGGHGSDVAESIVSAEVFDTASGEVATLSAFDLNLRFRSSSIKPEQVVLYARFALSRGSRAEGERLLHDIVAWRRENQPGGQNAGSVFVNPFDGRESAGRLIDEAGLKGRRLRTARVSEKHANFIQADPGGSADDVFELMCLVADRVEEHHGIRLRSEVRLVGFEAEALAHESTDPGPNR